MTKIVCLKNDSFIIYAQMRRQRVHYISPLTYGISTATESSAFELHNVWQNTPMSVFLKTKTQPRFGKVKLVLACFWCRQIIRT